MDWNSCEVKVGRLMEIRVRGYRSVTDVNDMIAMIKGFMDSSASQKKFVITADWRAVNVMSPETAARARVMLTLSNPRVLRSAILVSPEQSTSNLQVLRLVREAENEQRRMFTDVRLQTGWLTEILSPEEVTRLREFHGMGSAP